MPAWIEEIWYKGRVTGSDGKCRGCGSETKCDCRWHVCPVCGDLCWVDGNDDYHCRTCDYSTRKEWD